MVINMYMPPWLEGTPLADEWLRAWTETGDGALALEAVRRHEAYDEVFAGNRRDDGTLRYDENTYFGIIESYEDALLSINVNPDLFRDKFADMLEGLVSPNEFNARVQTVWERVIDAAPAIRDYYATNFGMDFTDAGIIASFLDPDVGDAILNKNIAMSEVGGEASGRGFTVSTEFAKQLVNAGLDTASEAAQFFGSAENLIPTLSILAQRHENPDDDFNLEDFSQASIFNDPEQRRRIRRLQAQERASFREGVGQGGLLARGQSGGVTGLVKR